MSECPEVEALERWCAGGEDAALAAHVGHCADCRALADELRANLAATARWGKLPPADDEPTPPTIPGLRLDGCIASGGQGTVWRGEQLATGRAVAVKTIRRAADATARARFAREAQLGASLRHANLVSVLDAGATGDGVLYLVMEYVDGETLEAARQRAEPSVDDALACFLAITDGVRFAHQHGVLHRDLKPGNLLRTQDGSVRILDFGLAKALAAVQPDPHTTLDGTFVGTLACAAPEQLRADGTPGDVRTDLFQLGVVFYRYLTGDWPHPPEADPRAMLARRLHDAPARPSRLRPDLPADLDTVVLRLLAPEPERRYATAHELWTDLERCRTGLPILARADEIQVRIGRLLRRYRTAAIAAAVVVVGLGAATWLVLGYAARAEADRRTIAREYERAEEALGILQRAMDAFEAGPAGPKTPMVDFLDRVVTELEQRPIADARARADLLLRAADLYSRIADPARAAPFVARARAVLHAAGDVDRTTDLDLRSRELRLLALSPRPDPELPAALRAHRAAVAAHHGEDAAATLQLDVLLAIQGSGSAAARSLQRLRAIAPRIAALPAGPERDRVQGQHDFVAVMIAANAGAHAEALQRGHALLQQPVGPLMPIACDGSRSCRWSPRRRCRPGNSNSPTRSAPSWPLAPRSWHCPTIRAAPTLRSCAACACCAPTAVSRRRRTCATTWQRSIAASSPSPRSWRWPACSSAARRGSMRTTRPPSNGCRAPAAASPIRRAPTNSPRWNRCWPIPCCGCSGATRPCRCCVRRGSAPSRGTARITPPCASSMPCSSALDERDAAARAGRSLDLEQQGVGRGNAVDARRVEAEHLQHREVVGATERELAEPRTRARQPGHATVRHREQRERLRHVDVDRGPEHAVRHQRLLADHQEQRAAAEQSTRQRRQGCVAAASDAEHQRHDVAGAGTADADPLQRRGAQQLDVHHLGQEVRRRSRRDEVVRRTDEHHVPPVPRHRRQQRLAVAVDAVGARRDEHFAGVDVGHVDLRDGERRRQQLAQGDPRREHHPPRVVEEPRRHEVGAGVTDRRRPERRDGEVARGAQQAIAHQERRPLGRQRRRLREVGRERREHDEAAVGGDRPRALAVGRTLHAAGADRDPFGHPGDHVAQEQVGARIGVAGHQVRMQRREADEAPVRREVAGAEVRGARRAIGGDDDVLQAAGQPIKAVQRQADRVAARQVGGVGHE
ncbi:MAG: serine/threonine protein kinase [Phycisphaerales bacterium]|nr:serine/threonine protein kinase [Phycisphaerales bacterium]